MRTKLFMLLPLAGLAVAMIGVPASQGADPFVAGGPSSRTVALDLPASDRALDRARAVGRALGLGGTRQTVTRLDDRFDHHAQVQAASAVVSARYGLVFQQALMSYYTGELDPAHVVLNG